MRDVFIFAAGSTAGVFVGGIIWIAVLCWRWSRAAGCVAIRSVQRSTNYVD